MKQVKHYKWGLLTALVLLPLLAATAVVTNISIMHSGDGRVYIGSSTGRGAFMPMASEQQHGLMSKSDKTLVRALPVPTVTPIPTATPVSLASESRDGLMSAKQMKFVDSMEARGFGDAVVISGLLVQGNQLTLTTSLGDQVVIPVVTPVPEPFKVYFGFSADATFTVSEFTIVQEFTSPASVYRLTIPSQTFAGDPERIYDAFAVPSDRIVRTAQSGCAFDVLSRYSAGSPITIDSVEYTPYIPDSSGITIIYTQVSGYEWCFVID